MAGDDTDSSPLMSDPPTIPRARSIRYLLAGQGLHAGAAVLLGATAWALARPAIDGGSFAGIDEATWFWATVGACVVHQAYTWLGFRGQLGWGVFTRAFGRRDTTAFAAGFLPLLIARPLLIAAVGLADQGSLALPRWIGLLLGLGLLVPVGATAVSIRRHFGLERALGGDHFRRRYREMPLVTGGVYRWTPNAMYAFAFLGLWSIAFLLGSHVALVAALFQHAFVWAHYLGTERPDMRLIYGEGPAGATTR